MKESKAAVAIRKVRGSDVEFVREMIGSVWQIERFSDREGIIYQSLEANRCRMMCHADFIRIAECDGHPAGIVAASMGRVPLMQRCRYVLPWHYHRLRALAACGDDARTVKAYFAVEDSYEKLLERVSGNLGSELILFAVDRSIRGRGIGGRLMQAYTEECRRRKIEDMYLFTDTFCDYGYYDHNGFELRGSEHLQLELAHERIDHTTFLYSKRLSQE